jgi:dihydrofolate synthase/folylpolyglutamate synthase
VVIETINELNNLGYNISYENLYTAIKNTSFIGRLDVVKGDYMTVLDGAHNPNGARVLKQFISENNKGRKIILIVGMIYGKQHEEYFKELKGMADNVIITEIKDKIKKSADINVLFEIAKKYNKNVEIELSHKEAYEKAKKLCGKNDMIIVTGSLYLMSEFYELYK